ncbi:SAM-dependent methyltransferase [Myxococcus sp. K38C18041901]|uniref:SAM-dependent methyltransferase n=1 Tax=Myxococcus guangdongensis TaxID=2906760 RepID=UPI0020A806B2|nr:SAM-dependent methyltransferase [Myxococcus guangdongensis]MCP3063630.1 SAM-dependent methyltransferase [Myxococcus guangdongensis]
MTFDAQDWVPYDEGHRWRAHASYFETRGIRAWTEGDIPYRATNNHAFAHQHAVLLLALVHSLQAEGRVTSETRIQVLELGGGLGDFCVGVLLALRDELGEAGRALFDRVSYVFTDVSRLSLEQAIQRAALAGFVASGHVLPALVDGRAPSVAHTLDGEAVTLAPWAVLANYLCCVLPTKVFRKRADTWLELHSRNLRPLTEDARSSEPEATEEAARWRTLLGEHAWLPVDPRATFRGAHHAALLEEVLAQDVEAELAYPYAFMELLDSFLTRMPHGGVFLFSDFEDGSSPGHIASISRVPVVYGDSLNHPVCFPLFTPWARLRGAELLVNPGWHGSTRTALWRSGAPIASSLREAFTRGFIQSQASQDRLDFELAAQKLSEAGEHKRALRFYDRCIALDPHALTLYVQAGAVALALDDFETALRYLREGDSRDGLRQQDFSLRMSDVFCRQGDFLQAGALLERAVQEHEAPLTYVALGRVYLELGEHARAFQACARAGELSPDHQEVTQLLSEVQGAWCEAELGLTALARGWWQDKLRTLNQTTRETPS